MPFHFQFQKQWLIRVLIVAFFSASHVCHAQTVQAVEYFFDNDPGFGNAISIPVSASSTIEDVTQSINISSLSYGFHTVFIRSRSSSGTWSLTNQFSFLKMRGDYPIKETEYYFDIDPGFGKGTPLAFHPNNALADFVAQLNITSLTPGTHRLFIRSKEGNDNWSLTNWMDITITASDAAPFINVNSVTDYNLCSGTSFRMAFHTTGSYTFGNIFKVQLSDATGSFNAPIEIGSITDTTDRIITCVLPKVLPYGTEYRIRVVSTTPTVTGIANAFPITIKPAPDLGNDTTVYILCAQDKFNLTPVFNTTGLITTWSAANPTMAVKGNHQLIVTNSYGCKDTAIATVKQDVAFWTGAISSNWHLAGNWSSGRIPNEKTHVIIQAGSSNACVISASNATAASIQVRNGGAYQTTAGKVLNVVANCNPLPSNPE